MGFPNVACVQVFSWHRGPSQASPPADPCTSWAMPSVVDRRSSAILLDTDEEEGELPHPLPSWAHRPDLDPPSSSRLMRVEVFDSIPKSERFFAFASCGDNFVPRKTMTCGICLLFLDEPAACAECTFLACRGCWEKHYTTGRAHCPACRTTQPLPKVSKHLLPLLEEELRENNVTFRCNTNPPGTCHNALWCCERSFTSLRDLREHLRSSGSFRHTRARLNLLLQLSLMGDKKAQAELYDNAVHRDQLRTIMEEDSIRLRASAARRRTRSRSRSVRRVLIDAPWRAPPTP